MGLSSLDTVNKALESPSEALAIQVSRQRHHTGPTRGRFRRENVGSGMRDMPMPAVRFPTSRGRQECKVSSGSEPPRRPAPRDVSIQTKAPECDEDRRIFRQWVSGRGRLSREKNRALFLREAASHPCPPWPNHQILLVFTQLGSDFVNCQAGATIDRVFFLSRVNNLPVSRYNE